MLPGAGKTFFFWDWNAHGGCARTPNCDRNHEAMSEKNLHWAIAAELIRRGGRKNRPNAYSNGECRRNGRSAARVESEDTWGTNTGDDKSLVAKDSRIGEF